MHESLTSPIIFLSYARKDLQIALRLKTDLQQRNIPVWIDKDGLKPGTPDWEDMLRTKIRVAYAVLLVASPNAQASRYVKDELSIAEMYERPIYPLWVSGKHWMEAIPIGLGRTQYVDMRGENYLPALVTIERALRILIDAPTRLPIINENLNFEPRNPYKGLNAFDYQDADDFFGRGDFVDELISTLERTIVMEQGDMPSVRLLAVVGASGSGKSSAVMAGLLPHLHHGGIAGSKHWIYLDPITPGIHPLESLTLALAEYFNDRSIKTIREDLADDGARGLHMLASMLLMQQNIPEKRILLFIDQFEELFTQTVNEEERQAFIDLVRIAMTEPQGPVIVVLTLRADFYDRPLNYPEFGRLIQDHHKLIFSMSLQNLRAAIEKPAALPDVKLTFEDNLIGDLLFEVSGQPSVLPLLQFTLDQLFEHRQGHIITRQAYDEIGGVKGALAKHAESTYIALPTDEHRRFTRALFLRLIDPGATEIDTTRRRIPFSELMLSDPNASAIIKEVAKNFISARLLTTNIVANISTLEVSHEALFREWDRLVDWIHTNQSDILLQKAISEDVADWLHYGRPIDRLYRGGQLFEAQSWAKRNISSRDELTFIQASATEVARREQEEWSQQTRELKLQRRAASRQRYVIGLMGIASFILIVGLVVALLLSNNLARVNQSLRASLPVSVINLNNSGPGSLREAINVSKSGSTITFQKDLKGTIVLGGLPLVIDKNLELRGPDTLSITISGNNKSKVFLIANHAIVTLNNLVIRDGYATNNTKLGPGAGAGIENLGNLTVINTIVTHNIAYASGGGILNLGSMTLINSTISNNSAGQAGGGITNIGVILTLVNSTISDNSTTNDGIKETPGGNGGGIFNVSELFINSSTISGNIARGVGIYDGGGGIENAEGTMLITSSTISGNVSAKAGGGIFSGLGTALIVFCTVSDNTAPSGGGIFNFNKHQSNAITLVSSIVADNTATDNTVANEADVYGSFTLIYNNLIQHVTPEQIVFGADPNVPLSNILAKQSIFGKSAFLGSLQNNGGFTKTQALLPESPAIGQQPLDRGHCASIDSFDILFDQRGISRFPSPAERNRCDLGAYQTEGNAS